MVGRFSKPTRAPFGGQPPKSTPFRVYFLNSIEISYFVFLGSTLAKLLAPSADFSKLGPDLAKFGYFCIKRPFTESLEGPGTRFGQIWLFLH